MWSLSGPGGPQSQAPRSDIYMTHGNIVEARKRVANQNGGLFLFSFPNLQTT